MSEDLSLFHQNTIIAIWWLAWAGFCILVALVSLSLDGGAVSLSISGSASGQGFQNLSYAGDLLNVSISQNGTGWNISLLGGML